MAQWSSGYVVDVDYSFGFYQEMAPSLLSFSALLQGVDAPGLDLRPLTYCELGCGQGFTANVIAAANPHVQVYATDFNPAHITFAHRLAEAGKLGNVHFADDSFAEFAQRDDLPDFDVIALHGIYSWISPENRGVIVEFIRRKLKPGGMVYISYNAMPGWASIMPLRRLMLEHAEGSGSLQGLMPRIASARDFANKLKELESTFFERNPRASARLDDIKDKDPHYLAHEYFNRDLTPFYFTDLAADLAEAKLTWVGTANPVETLDAIHLTREQQDFLAGLDNVAFAQTVRDHMIDQQFRRDLFVKGPVRLTQAAAREKWLDTRFTLLRTSPDIPRQVQGMRFKADMKPELYDPLIAAFGDRPKTLRELMRDPALAGLDFSWVTQAMTFLVGSGSCYPSLPEEGSRERRNHAERFNRAVATLPGALNKLNRFASGVAGNGVPTNSIEIMIWLALQDGASDLAQAVAERFAREGRKLVVAGAELQTPEENLAEIRKRVADFERKTLPVWRAMEVVPPAKPNQGRQRA